jgi:hypothetical protein
MSLGIVTAVMVLLIVAGRIYDYKHSPFCNWCQMRHRGRCIFNPRSGRMFANTQDGHFDYDDPNQ